MIGDTTPNMKTMIIWLVMKTVFQKENLPKKKKMKMSLMSLSKKINTLGNNFFLSPFFQLIPYKRIQHLPFPVPQFHDR
nr:MAG TPA: hypothetical protein [Caudoviricetes sp.]